eukprot:481008_1
MASTAEQAESLKEVFTAYAHYGHSALQLKNHPIPQMDGRTLVKLSKQSKLICSKLRTSDVDLLFAKCKTKGKRVINYKQFQDVLKHIAAKRGVSVESIESKIIKSGVPKNNHATKADKVRFYDDKRLYTGTWKKGGPDRFVKGGHFDKLEGLLDRSEADVRGVKKNNRLKAPSKSMLKSTSVKFSEKKSCNCSDTSCQEILKLMKAFQDDGDCCELKKKLKNVFAN